LKGSVASSIGANVAGPQDPMKFLNTGTATGSPVGIAQDINKQKRNMHTPHLNMMVNH